jgi:hypothetical protein
MSRLALHVEGDAIGGLGLDLKASSRAVVEVLVKELSDKVILAWDFAILRPPFPASLRNNVGEWPTQHIHRSPPWRCRRKQQEQPLCRIELVIRR